MIAASVATPLMGGCVERSSGDTDGASEDGGEDAEEVPRTDVAADPAFCSEPAGEAPNVRFDYTGPDLETVGPLLDVACDVEEFGYSHGEAVLYAGCDSPEGVFQARIDWTFELGPEAGLIGERVLLSIEGHRTVTWPQTNLTSFTMRSESGALLFGAIRKQDSVIDTSPLSLAPEAGPCQPFRGPCHDEEFMGQVTVGLEGVFKTLTPFEVTFLGRYTLRTGKLEFPNTSSPSRCDGVDHGRYFVVFARTG